MRITLDHALRIVNLVVNEARRDGGKPIAVTVVGADGRRIASASMDGVMPVSIGLAENKAYTAIQGQRPTLEWEEMKLDGRNFTDPRFTCFGGGVPIMEDVPTAVTGENIGAIGVSGRHSNRKGLPDGDPLQDHELALLGADFLS